MDVLIGHLRSCPFSEVDGTIRIGRRVSGKEKKKNKTQTVLGKELLMMATGLCSVSSREPVWVVKQRIALVRARLQGH